MSTTLAGESGEPESGRPAMAPIFVGGAGRSGTTLLRLMLDSHPRIACGPELKVVPPWLGQWRLDRKSFGPYAAEYLGLAAEVVDDAYRAKVSVLLEEARRRSGKPRVADKTPNLVFHFGPLHRLFPESSLIHLIRDGRDVVASLLGVDWYEPDGGRLAFTRTAEAAAGYWAQAVRAGRKARRHLGDAVLEVRYEDLVRETEREMRRVLDHLDEPWDAAVLRHFDQPHDLAAEPGAEEAMRPVYTSSVGRWRRVLSREDLTTVERVAGSLLEELGYE
jgi:hypothetical protein